MLTRFACAATVSLGLLLGQTGAGTEKAAGTAKKDSTKKSGSRARSAGAGDQGAAYTPGVAKGTADTTVDAVGGLIDINSATADDLKGLGIADEWVQRIINGRPYYSKTQLAQKNIIPSAAYDKIKDKIMVRQKSQR